MKVQVFDRNSKNEATWVYDVPMYALYQPKHWQEMWEKVELKPRSGVINFDVYELSFKPTGDRLR